MHSWARASQVQKDLQQHRKRSTRYAIWTQKVPSLLFCKRAEYNYRSQTANYNIWKRHSNIITEITTHSTQNTPIQSWDHIQTWTGSNHSRLAVQTNHKKNKGAEIPGMQINSNAIQTTTNISDCMTIHKLQQATSQDKLLQHFQEHIIRGWPEHRDDLPQDMRTYWTFCDDMAVIDRVILKGKHVVIPEVLSRQALEQPHVKIWELRKLMS